jgi:hypothetical protein
VELEEKGEDVRGIHRRALNVSPQPHAVFGGEAYLERTQLFSQKAAVCGLPDNERDGRSSSLFEIFVLSELFVKDERTNLKLKINVSPAILHHLSPFVPSCRGRTQQLISKSQEVKNLRRWVSFGNRISFCFETHTTHHTHNRKTEIVQQQRGSIV